MNIAELKPFQDCTALLRMTDGEELKAKIAFVVLECEDVIVDVLQTSKPEYKNKNSAYTVKATDVVTIEKVSRD